MRKEFAGGGNELRLLRLTVRLSQLELARRAHVAPGSVSKVENGYMVDRNGRVYQSMRRVLLEEHARQQEGSR